MIPCAHDWTFDKAGRPGLSAAARAALARYDKLVLFLEDEFAAAVDDASDAFSLGTLAELITDANAGGYLWKDDEPVTLTFNTAQPLNLTFLGRPYVVLDVDIARFDAAWDREGFDYEADADRVIMESLRRTAARGIELPPPAVAWTHDGWGFFEGRNRYLYMRDSGFEKMPIAVPLDDAKRLMKAAGLASLAAGTGGAVHADAYARPYADILDAVDHVSFQIAQRFATAVMMCAIVGGDAETARIARLLDLRSRRASKLTPVMDFETPNINALNELRMSLMGLIREVSDDQRAAILQALKDGVARGLNPIEIARSFRGTIGLTSAQERYIANYRRALEQVHADVEAKVDALGRALRDGRFDGSVARAFDTGKALTPDQINKMVERYRERWIKHRAETIARTEALTAAHMGELAAWEAAIEAGDIKAHEITQTWVSAHDSRVRLTHRALDSQQRQWGKPFDSPSGAKIRFPGDPLAPPRERINCRCVLTRQISEVPLNPDGTPIVNYAEELAHDAAGTGTAQAEAVAGIEENHGYELVRDAEGGTKPKQIWRDADGNEYLFKPVKEGEEFIVEGEVAGSKISQVVNPLAPDVEGITLDGKYGSFQKLIDNTGDISKLDINAMTKQQLAAIQKEQVVDWLISNADAHPENFLKIGSGKSPKIVPIDKGQAFKYFGQDFLDITYASPTNAIGTKYETIYSRLWRLYMSSPSFAKNVDFKPTFDAIKKLQGISDKAFRELLMPYAESRFKGDPRKIEFFLDLATKRKRSLELDFRRFFLSLENVEEAGVGALREGSWVNDKLFAEASSRLKAINMDGVVSKEEAAALISYTGNLYQAINKPLLEAAKGGKGVLNLGRHIEWTRSARISRLVDAALAKLKPYKGTSYRNILVRQADIARWLKDYQIGKTVVWPALSSTSKSAHVFGGGANVRFVISGRTGRLIEELSSHSNEQEVLFATNSRFIVRDVDQSAKRITVYLDDVSTGIDFNKI